MTKTVSFTLRLPIKVKDAIDQKVPDGKRSEFIIELLEAHLGLSDETPKFLTADDSHRAIEKITELNLKIEVLKTILQDNVLQRLEDLENKLTTSNASSCP